MNNFHTNCLVCASPDILPLNGYYENHFLVKCTNCKLVFSHKIPSEKELNEHYAAYSYDREVNPPQETLKSYANLLDNFERFRKHNRLLDVGCGRGWFLIEAQKRGWEVYGTEFSDKAIEICERNGIRMFSGKLSGESLADNFFDVITSFEVIEHINNPLEDVSIIHQALRSGGLFYCTTPNFNSIMRYYLKEKYNVIEYPEHLTYYTKKTLTHTIEKFQFRRMAFRSTGISITRIRQSTGNTSDKTHNLSEDERLREQIAVKWYLRAAKKILNTLFTLTNSGLTLKAHYIKE